MNELTISFIGPFSWPATPDAPSIFDSDLRREAGLYLWTVRFDDGYLVYYVGETGRSFETRFLEHYCEHASGMYHVNYPAEFSCGEKVMIWPGRYDPTMKKSAKECILECLRLGEPITKLAYIYRFFLAPLSCETRIRRRIEAAIANTLYAAPSSVGLFQETGIRYHPRTQEETAIICRVSSSMPLLGIPEWLLV